MYETSHVIYALAWKLFWKRLARGRRQHYTFQQLAQIQLACLEEALDTYGEQAKVTTETVR